MRQVKFAHSLLSTRKSAPVRRPRLALRPLEDRCVPATFTVNELDDNGSGSGLVGDIRFAVNTAAANDVIEFDTTLFATPQTIPLSAGQLTISKNVAVNMDVLSWLVAAVAGARFGQGPVSDPSPSLLARTGGWNYEAERDATRRPEASVEATSRSAVPLRPGPTD